MPLHLPLPRRHWTPRYVLDRASLAVWERRHPDAPWLAPEAVDFLGQWLRPEDTVVEFGAGRSTAWIAARAGRVISLEHHEGWYETVRRRLAEDGLDRVNLLRVPLEADAYVGPAEAALNPSGGEEPDARADLVLVDGRFRDRAARWALDRVAPGGLLVIDDAERYVPGPARGPESIGPDGATDGPVWAEVWSALSTRRRVWFDSGVNATLVVFM